MATTMATPTRQPFGELTGTRHLALASTKNQQNAITDMLGLTKDEKTFKPELFMKTSNKRAATPTFDDDNDAENVDPSTTSTKKVKASDGSAVKKITLKTINGDETAYKLPVQPATAPAGRSPKHKRVGILSRKRAFNRNVKRVNPPSFGPAKSLFGNSGISSIDATLNVPKPTTKTTTPDPMPTRSYGSSPKSWFFDIHEDTPDDEAYIKMEHSTCILDVSSDDESGPPKDTRGKENIPPPHHAGEGTNTNEQTRVNTRRVTKADAMDVPRSPLGSLDAEDFYDHGLDASSVEVIAPELDDDHNQRLDAGAAALKSNLPALQVEVAA